MKLQIDTLNLQPGQQVYYLGLLSSIIGYRTNPTAGWGTILEVQPAVKHAPLCYVVDMGPDYCSAGDRIKKVPHFLFGPCFGQMFLTEEQINVEADRQQKNQALNEFYKSLNRQPLKNILCNGRARTVTFPS